MEKKYFTFNQAQTSECPFLNQTTVYLQEFLGKPHEKLQEKGHNSSVCPFTPKVLNYQTVVFGHEHINTIVNTSNESIRTALIAEHMPHFLNSVISQTQQEVRHLACLLIVVSGLETEQECNTYVSMVQKELQPEFVKNGLLLSELHPFSPVPSVRNSDFFPSRSPFPLFFIRKLIPNDIPYILRTDRYDEETYRNLFYSIHSNFGVETVEKEMARLQKEIVLPKCQAMRNGVCPCSEKSFSEILWYGFFPFQESCYTCVCTGRLVRGLGDVFVM